MTTLIETNIFTAGSESRDIEVIREVMGDHKHCHQMRDTIVKGREYHMGALDEEQRKKDMNHMIKRENHKSATKEENHNPNFQSIQSNSVQS